MNTIAAHRAAHAVTGSHFFATKAGGWVLVGAALFVIAAVLFGNSRRDGNGVAVFGAIWLAGTTWAALKTPAFAHLNPRGHELLAVIFWIPAAVIAILAARSRGVASMPARSSYGSWG